MDSVSLLWPWDVAPPVPGNAQVVAGGTGSFPARVRELGSRARGEWILLPREPSETAAKEALSAPGRPPMTG